MTGFRNFVLSCALAAASMIPPVAPVQAMPRPTLDIEIKAPGDIQSADHRGWRRGYYNGWGHGYYPRYGHRYRRSGISIFIGPSLGYFPRRHFYGDRYYFGPRHYGPGYYPYRHYGGYNPYRYHRSDYYGHRYHRPGHFGIYMGW